jgi:flagellar basal body-associated protein FliL
MSEEKSLLSTCIACIVGAIVFWKGLVRGNQNGTNTWVEMLNVVKDPVFWVFLMIFTAVIVAAIIFLVFVTFEKLRAIFVNWKKSGMWCAEVDKDRHEQKQENAQLKEENRELKSLYTGVLNELSDLQQKYLELRAFTGIDIKQAEARAEEEVLEGV